MPVHGWGSAFLFIFIALLSDSIYIANFYHLFCLLKPPPSFYCCHMNGNSSFFLKKKQKHLSLYKRKNNKIFQKDLHFCFFLFSVRSKPGFNHIYTTSCSRRDCPNVYTCLSVLLSIALYNIHAIFLCSEVS